MNGKLGFFFFWGPQFNTFAGAGINLYFRKPGNLPQ